MSNDIEIAKAVARLFAAFPYLRPDQVREGTQAYADGLIGLDPKFVDIAVRELIQTSERLPLVRDVRIAAMQAERASQAKIGGKSDRAVLDTADAKAIYRQRLDALHAATSNRCSELAKANNLSEPEARMLLEQEIRGRLWRAAVDEAQGRPRQPLKVTEIELTGWRDRCDTWGRLPANPALKERTASVLTRIADHDRAKNGQENPQPEGR